MHRFVDRAGRECAYYDTTLLFPLNAQNLGDQPTGVAVLDVSDPANPKRTATLATPAMQSPHESVNISKERGLLAAVLGNPGAAPGIVDVYDLNADCRQPELQASAPVGFLGHESGFAPDGKTFYATSLFDGHITAVDLTNPRVPTPVAVIDSFSHGMNTSDDGNRGYIAARAIGLQILDLSEVQARKPLPQVREISRLTWDTMSIPQNAVPITIDGKPFVMEVDEFSVDEPGSEFPGAERPVRRRRAPDRHLRRDKAAPGVGRCGSRSTSPRTARSSRTTRPRPASCRATRGTTATSRGGRTPGSSPARSSTPGCACSTSPIPRSRRRSPTSSPRRRPSPVINERSNYAMSSPDFAPERDEIWYSDGNSGFYVVRLANGVWPEDAGGDCRRVSKVGFKIHRTGGNRVVRVDAYVDGKRRLVRRGRDIARIELSGLPRTGKMRIRIVATHSTGSKVVSTRSWNGCRKGKPSVTRIPRR